MLYRQLIVALGLLAVIRNACGAQEDRANVAATLLLRSRRTWPAIRASTTASAIAAPPTTCTRVRPWPRSWLGEPGLATAAAIHDGDPYTQGLAQAFADAFEAAGGTITGLSAVNKDDTDMVPALTEIRDRGRSPRGAVLPDL